MNWKKCIDKLAAGKSPAAIVDNIEKLKIEDIAKSSQLKDLMKGLLSALCDADETLGLRIIALITSVKRHPDFKMNPDNYLALIADHAVANPDADFTIELLDALKDMNELTQEQWRETILGALEPFIRSLTMAYETRVPIVIEPLVENIKGLLVPLKIFSCLVAYECIGGGVKGGQAELIYQAQYALAKLYAYFEDVPKPVLYQMMDILHTPNLLFSKTDLAHAKSMHKWRNMLIEASNQDAAADALLFISMWCFSSEHFDFSSLQNIVKQDDILTWLKKAGFMAKSCEGMQHTLSMDIVIALYNVAMNAYAHANRLDQFFIGSQMMLENDFSGDALFKFTHQSYQRKNAILNACIDIAKGQYDAFWVNAESALDEEDERTLITASDAQIKKHALNVLVTTIVNLPSVFGAEIGYQYIYRVAMSVNENESAIAEPVLVQLRTAIAKAKKELDEMADMAVAAIVSPADIEEISVELGEELAQFTAAVEDEGDKSLKKDTGACETKGEDGSEAFSMLAFKQCKKEGESLDNLRLVALIEDLERRVDGMLGNKKPCDNSNLLLLLTDFCDAILTSQPVNNVYSAIYAKIKNQVVSFALSDREDQSQLEALRDLLFAAVPEKMVQDDPVYYSYLKKILLNKERIDDWSNADTVAFCCVGFDEAEEELGEDTQEIVRNCVQKIICDDHYGAHATIYSSDLDHKWVLRFFEKLDYQITTDKEYQYCLAAYPQHMDAFTSFINLPSAKACVVECATEDMQTQTSSVSFASKATQTTQKSDQRRLAGALEKLGELRAKLEEARANETMLKTELEEAQRKPEQERADEKDKLHKANRATVATQSAHKALMKRFEELESQMAQAEAAAVHAINEASGEGEAKGDDASPADFATSTPEVVPFHLFVWMQQQLQAQYAEKQALKAQNSDLARVYQVNAALVAENTMLRNTNTALHAANQQLGGEVESLRVVNGRLNAAITSPASTAYSPRLSAGAPALAASATGGEATASSPSPLSSSTSES